MAVLPNGDLVAGGQFTIAGGVSAQNIARWDGASWHPLGAGINGAVFALHVAPDGTLFAGGHFGSAGNISASNIARWDGSTWSALGAGLDSSVGSANVYSIATMPSGELSVGGSFDLAGSTPVRNWARWTDTGVPWVAYQPRPVRVWVGDTITLSATPANEYALVAYQWQKDGSDLHDGPGGAGPHGGIVAGANGTLGARTNGIPATLTITAARVSDAGIFTVSFANPCGVVTATQTEVVVCAGDLDDGSGTGRHDGGIDISDLLYFLSGFQAGRISTVDLDDGSGSGTPDGGVDINDLLFFLVRYEAGDTSGADLDDGSGTGTPDGGVDINDLLFFLSHYEEGC